MDILDILSKNLEVKGILEILAMDEIVKTAKEGIIDIIAVIGAAIVLHLKTQWRENAVLSEIEAAGDLHVSSAWSDFLALCILAVEVIVNEEEGVSPIVIVETLESSGHMIAAFAEIVKNLEVGLALRSLWQESSGRENSGKKEFLGHNYFFVLNLFTSKSTEVSPLSFLAL